jgi:hypothetical protein
MAERTLGHLSSPSYKENQPYIFGFIKCSNAAAEL